jgi:hypothetical protein
MSLLLSVASCGCLPLSLVSAPLALAVWVGAAADLAKMRAGLMDPAGRRLTEQARWDAVGGALLPVLALALWSYMALAAWLR